jgi:2-polyprenyl-6-methoxyphenol hydroxylase-like FAD-dependent oxidoreductase
MSSRQPGISYVCARRERQPVVGLGGGMYEVVIVGGGIAGSALATVLARAGKAVLVLEREAVYRDRVRGEFLQPWGVAEAMHLGVHAALASMGKHHSQLVPYDETLEPAEAEHAVVRLDQVVPGAPGSLGVAHPAACEALACAANAAGAHVLRGVSAVVIEPGNSPRIGVRVGTDEHTVRCRLIVGADGRESAVRRQLGMTLHATEPRLLGAGLLVNNLRDWPDDRAAIGTEGDRVFFVLPQGGGRARLYLMYSPLQRRRFVGHDAARTFLEDFHLACIPDSERLTSAEPAGPCAVYPMNDTWLDTPLADGVALIGDAAGYSDPHHGQGLSLALRDVRALTELLLSSQDWSVAQLRPYVDERAERGRRVRVCADLLTTFRGEFGPEARERRRRAQALMRAEPELALWRRATVVGPDALPAEAFDDSIAARLFR